MKDCYDLYEHWYCKNEIGPVDGFFEFYTLLEERVPDSTGKSFSKVSLRLPAAWSSRVS